MPLSGAFAFEGAGDPRWSERKGTLVMTGKVFSHGDVVPLGRALVVEDDAMIAMDMASALTDGGAERVVICASIAAALEEFERLKPDVLVLDVCLADRDDGWSLAELAFQLAPVPPLIVFSTGVPNSIPPATAGLGHVLVKPFPPDTLVQLVRTHRTRPSLLARLRNALPG